ncbi:MAG: threonylcarbamoyl-AMP synthase [Legionellales bacterium]|nr:threonylcarbamoyl-AMP synthase [Legionellales bacterium]|tara:strand:- start:2203 stop:2760 length:558 start_codon:yes stop_codon:yes gene_type:complete
MQVTSDSNQVIDCLNTGGVIAYPTESVFGIGCDALCQDSVARISRIKNRQSKKGYILLIHSYEQLDHLIDQSHPNLNWGCIRDSWPGPTTWVFPAATNLPHWLVSDCQTIAIRMTSHPIARALCKQLDKPLISTSANLAGMPPCTTVQQVADQLSTVIDLCVYNETSCSQAATTINDAITLACYR